MHLIELMGPIDKRGILYPLMKAAILSGKVLLLGDDPNLCRFCEGFNTEGAVDKSDIRVVPQVSAELIDSFVSRCEQSYDFVIVVSTSVLLRDVDTFVYCHGGGYALIDEEVLDKLGDDFEYPDVRISFSKASAKGALQLVPGPDVMGYVWACEEARAFVPCKVKSLVELSSELFASALSLDKGAYATLLRR